MRLYLEILEDIFREKEGDKKKNLEKIDEELTSIEKALFEIDNTYYVQKKMEEGSYKRLKDSLSQRKTELSLKKEDLIKAGDNFMEYQEFGVSIVANLDAAFDNAIPELKGKILGSIFPQRLVYEEKKYRTTKLNEVVDLPWNFQAGFEEIKTGQAITTNHLSCLAPRVGLEPTTLRLTAACSTIELSRNGIGISTPKIYPKRCEKSRHNWPFSDEIAESFS